MKLSTSPKDGYTMIDFITFARSYAILTIITMHVLMHTSNNSLFQRLLSFGGSGVHIFMFLSGFCLMLGTYSTPLHFYRKRFIRILIPYWIVVTVLFVLKNLIPAPGHEATLYAFLGHIFLFKMFDSSIFYSIGFEFWFISPLLQLYILFPLLRAFANRVRPAHFITVTLIISVTWWLCIISFSWYEIAPLRECFPQFLWTFALGVTASKLYTQRGMKFWNMKIWVALLISLAGYGGVIALSTIQENIFRVINDVPLAVGYMGVLILTYHILKKVLHKVYLIIVNTGLYSYELYLLHGTAMFLGFRLANYCNLQHGKGLIVPLIFIMVYFFAVGYKAILVRWLQFPDT